MFRWDWIWFRLRERWQLHPLLFLCHLPHRNCSWREDLCITVWTPFPTTWSWWTGRNWKILTDWFLVRPVPENLFLPKGKLPMLFLSRRMTLLSEIRKENTIPLSTHLEGRLSISRLPVTITSIQWTSTWIILMMITRWALRVISFCPCVSWLWVPEMVLKQKKSLSLTDACRLYTRNILKTLCRRICLYWEICTNACGNRKRFRHRGLRQHWKSMSTVP